MKRILVMLTAIIMLLALAACELDAPTNTNTKPEETKPSASVTQPTQTTTKPTTAPTEPTKVPTQPTTKPEEPTVPPTEPTVRPTEPTEPTTQPHAHDYTSTVTQPTCTEEGYTTYTCSCGDTYRDNSVEATGHSWTEANCTTAKTCSVCGKTDGTAEGHKWRDATCTAAKTCSVCGKAEGRANGHQWKDATCSTAKTCSVCGKTEGNAMGHEFREGACVRCGAKDPDYSGPELIDGMRPEFKAAMDSYETFMAEYCAFMRKYKENPNDLTLLTDYAEFMKEYADFAEKMNAWENDELNDTELKYYMDVTTRVAKMLLELEEEPGEDDPNLVDGMRPEFKEAMDAYEAFMIEYCEFMKKYKENPSDMSLLMQYVEMMNQYTEATQKLQEWSSGEMNNAEMQYYLDVTNRVSQMLMDAIG